MDDRNEDLIPEWQTKPNNTDTAPVTIEQPIKEYRAFSEPVPNEDVQQHQAKKGSGLGAASFILGLLGCILTVGLSILVVTLIMDWVNVDNNTFNMQDFKDNGNYPRLILIGLGIFGTMIAMFIGFILGIVALLQKNRKKGFAIAGTIINGIFVCGVVLLMAIGVLSNLAS
ncbi:MAG: DUF4190 domain-containing protein [Gorillibacterium sp.]|nr:DUF4190 domain-containing protein [Gorillibacterium sp.]